MSVTVRARFSIGVIVAIVTATIVGATFYHQFSSHEAKVSKIQRYIKIDEASLGNASSLKSEESPAIDAINSAISRLRSAPTSFSQIALYDDRLQHLQFEKTRIDTLIARHEQDSSNAWKAYNQARPRDVKGAFESYWHASDQLRDALLVYRGFVSQVEQNPFAAVMSARSTALPPLGSLQDRYIHAFQVLIDLLQNEDDDYNRLLNKDENSLREENKTWIFATH